MQTGVNMNINMYQYSILYEYDSLSIKQSITHLLLFLRFKNILQFMLLYQSMIMYNAESAIRFG